MQVFYWDDSSADVPGRRTLADIVNQLVKETPDEKDLFEFGDPADLKVPTTWGVVSCNAQLRRSSFAELNHFVPVFPQAQLGEQWSQEAKKAQDLGLDGIGGSGSSPRRSFCRNGTSECSMQSHANLGISFSSGSAVVPCPLQLVHSKTIKKPLGNH